jgi:hypothetical protein
LQVRLSVLACWHSLRCLERLTLIGLSFTAADAHHLTAFLQAGPSSSLTSLVLGDQQGLNFLSDKALEGLGQLLGPAGKLRLLDLSGCIELTDAGEAPANDALCCKCCVYGAWKAAEPWQQQSFHGRSICKHVHSHNHKLQHATTAHMLLLPSSLLSVCHPHHHHHHHHTNQVCNTWRASAAYAACSCQTQ